MSDSVSICLRLTLFMTACLVMATAGIAHGQTEPSDKPQWPSRMEALGNTEALSPLETAAFQDDPKLHFPKRPPGGMDWLSEHAEKGQTYDQFRLIISRVKPRANQQALCILPIGEFNTKAPSLETLRGYCERFFCLPTRILPALPMDQVPAKSRINAGTQKPQWLTTEILYWLQSQKPKDAFAVIAVTMQDLYPHERWNFVFGQAFQQGGVGVFSFARYHPQFYDVKDLSDDSSLVLARSAKVLSHEMGHLFGLKHCVFYECIMNGSNHLAETDACPMHLCPVCLRKLHLSLRFDLIRRESQLLKFYEEQQLQSEADWSRRYLEKLQKVPATAPKP
jgi:archaemetzincin